MKKVLLASLALYVSVLSCKKSDDDTTPETENLTAANVTRTNNSTAEAEPAANMLFGDITTNTVLKAGETYTLKSFVYVRNGATLRIEPGVTIKGDKTTKATLIITRNGKIDAQGTAAQPIVFTSGEATPNIGDWGGLIILGNAPTNGQFNGTTGLQEIEGGVNDSRGVGLHGGNKADDNSGVLKYVRVEFAGIAFQLNNEINGITFGSVGNGTTVDYVQVAYSGDDSFEWFGGTVNCKHLIAYRGTDDDFDTDNGFSGKIQFGIAVRDSALADFATGGASNSFESDNDATGSTATPQTAAVFSNMTLVGPTASALPANISAPFKRGAHIRRNSFTSVYNSVFVGWPTGILLDGTLTVAGAVANSLEIKNNLVARSNKVADSTGLGASATFAPLTWFATVGFSNTTKATVAEAGVTNLNYVNFDPSPAVGSPMLSGASFSSTKLGGGFFTTTTYIGAASSGDNWWQGWARFWNK